MLSYSNTTKYTKLIVVIFLNPTWRGTREKVFMANTDFYEVCKNNSLYTVFKHQKMNVKNIDPLFIWEIWSYTAIYHPQTISLHHQTNNNFVCLLDIEACTVWSKGRMLNIHIAFAYKLPLVLFWISMWGLVPTILKRSPNQIPNPLWKSPLGIFYT
jgi:hypothetical protein